MYIKKLQATSGIFHGIPRAITILLHVKEITVANTIIATYAQRMMQGLDVIPSSIQRRVSSILINCVFCYTDYTKLIIAYNIIKQQFDTIAASQRTKQSIDSSINLQSACLSKRHFFF